MNIAHWVRRLSLLFSLCVALPLRAETDLTVFAAASLRGALDDIAAAWSAPVQISYGGSGAIARQVSLGAPADVVFLANPEWMDWLAAGGHILPRTRQDILSNRLVVIGPVGSPALDGPLDARLGDGRLAMGHRAAVPAGSYAQAWLETVGLWNALAPRLAETENVRLAMALVARGEAPLGIVYASDARASDDVDVVFAVPADDHPPIRYPAAAVTAEGAAFVKYLTSPEASAIAARHGFIPLGP